MQFGLDETVKTAVEIMSYVEVYPVLHRNKLIAKNTKNLAVIKKF